MDGFGAERVNRTLDSVTSCKASLRVEIDHDHGESRRREEIREGRDRRRFTGPAFGSYDCDGWHFPTGS
jgi:hypothetical protein